MSLGLKWGSNDIPENPSGFIYFDCVTLYTQEFSGQITKHPIDSGASITDHFIKQNPIYNLSGIISGVDLSSTPFNIRDQEGNIAINARQQPVSISFNDSASGLLQYLPESISQFLSVGLSSPTLSDEIRTDLTFEILSKDLIRGLLNGLRFNPKTEQIESFIQTVDLYEFDGSNIRDITSDLVITSFKVREDEDTGDGLYFDLTLEQVTFVTLEKTQLPSGIVSSQKKNKGKQSSAPKDIEKAQEGGDATAPKTEASALKTLGLKSALGTGE